MDEQELIGSKSRLRFQREEDRYIPIVYVKSENVWKQAMSGEEFLTAELDGERVSGIIREVRAEDDKLIFEGELESEDKPFRFIGSCRLSIGDSEYFHFELMLTYEGDKEHKANFSIAFEVNDTGIPRWMLPGMFYKHNRPKNCFKMYPRYDPNEVDPDLFISNYWYFRSDRCALPAVFCWTDNFTTCLATKERFDDYVEDPSPFALFRDGISGLGFRGDEAHTQLYLFFPYREEPIKYTTCFGDGHKSIVRNLSIKNGAKFKLSFKLMACESELHAYNGFVRDIYDQEKSYNPPNSWIPKDQASSLTSYGIYHWHYDKENSALYETASFDKYFGKGDTYFDRPHMHVAWVSGVTYAYAILRQGREEGISEYEKAARVVIDKISSGIAPCGTFWPEWTRERGWGTGWNPKANWVQARTVSEATLFMIRALEYEKEFGYDHPNWEKAVKNNLEFALKVQREDGNFGSYYDIETGEVVEWDGAGSLMWIPALLASARYFSENKYRESAIKGGDYYTKFVDDEYIYGAPEDVHLTPTSEDGYNALIAYVHLYEATQDKRWLTYACKAADWMLTFRFAYNVKFPPFTILDDYNFHTVGADLASPSNNHLHNYGLICHPELLRLWSYTKDDYYLERARDHLYCFHQFIAREDGDFNARKGMITEQWYHTDWWQPKGAMLQLAHIWCAGFIAYANHETHDFGDIIVDVKEKNIHVIEPGVEIHQISFRDEIEFEIYNVWDRGVKDNLVILPSDQRWRLFLNGGEIKAEEGKFPIYLQPRGISRIRLTR